MSSQALNGNPTTGYSGYFGGTSVGSVPTRDASDITRQLKERLIYTGFKNSSPITPGGANLMFQRPGLNPAGANHIPGNSEWSWLPFGNQFRLSYLFGKMKSLNSGGCRTLAGSGVYLSQITTTVSSTISVASYTANSGAFACIGTVNLSTGQTLSWPSGATNVPTPFSRSTLYYVVPTVAGTSPSVIGFYLSATYGGSAITGGSNVSIASTATIFNPGAVLASGSTTATGTAYLVSADPVSLGYTVGMTVVMSGYGTSANNGTFVINALNRSNGGYYIQVVAASQSAQTTGTFGIINEGCVGGAFNGNGPKLPGSSTSTGS